MLTKIGASLEDTLNGKFLYDEHATPGITSQKVVKYMNKKYGVKARLGSFEDSDEPYVKKFLATGGTNAFTIKTPGGYDVPANKEPINKNPYIIAHEMGHVDNHSNGRMAPIYRSRTSKLNMLPIGAFMLGSLTHNKTLLKAGIAGLGVSQAITLADEYTASQKAHEAMQELGAPHRSKTLSKAFWTSYAPISAYMMGTAAATYGLVSHVAKLKGTL